MPNTPERIEVLSRIQRQRWYSLNEKIPASWPKLRRPGCPFPMWPAAMVSIPACNSGGDGAWPKAGKKLSWQTTPSLPHTAQPLQWLSDNGCAYRPHETIDFAISLGLLPCFTSVRSPQSNGMAAAFIKTFKRDYFYVHDRPDARTVLSQLSRWFEDYNEIHPHKALRLKSPRESIRSLQQRSACTSIEFKICANTCREPWRTAAESWLFVSRMKLVRDKYR